MYSRDQIETFRTILKPLCDTGTIPPELFAVALKAVKEHWQGETSTVPRGPERSLSRKEVAERLGVSSRTIDRYREHGLLKGYSYGPKIIRFLESEILAFQQGLQSEKEGGAK